MVSILNYGVHAPPSSTLPRTCPFSGLLHIKEEIGIGYVVRVPVSTYPVPQLIGRFMEQRFQNHPYITVDVYQAT